MVAFVKSGDMIFPQLSVEEDFDIVPAASGVANIAVRRRCHNRTADRNFEPPVLACHFFSAPRTHT